MSSPELLMPAGNLEKLKYAFAYGADAVYAGAPQYSLRARENQFRVEEIKQGIDYTRQLGKKFYLTANILAHNRKITGFMNNMREMILLKPDALIMADPGLINLVKNEFPETEIHLSVQANAMNWATVKFWYDLGVSRVILSRELSLDEIKEIKDKVPEMELEVFVHGAICIAHSGRCLLSNFFQYRDANDGCCTNACRWSYKTYTNKPLENTNPGFQEYKALEGEYFIEETNRPGELMQIDEDEYGTYIMNAKDLMAIEYLDELMKAGVDSFKIEGRTKSIYYLSMTTKAYRHAIDDLKSGKGFDPKYLAEMQKVHNRGYTAGFLVNRADSTIQRYDEGRTTIYSQEFAATVLKSEENRLLITPRNKLCVGDEIEVVTPTESFYTQVKSMITEEGEELEAIHGGTQVEVWIPFSHKIDSDFIIISRCVESEEEEVVKQIEV